VRRALEPGEKPQGSHLPAGDHFPCGLPLQAQASILPIDGTLRFFTWVFPPPERAAFSLSIDIATRSRCTLTFPLAAPPKPWRSASDLTFLSLVPHPICANLPSLNLDQPFALRLAQPCADNLPPWVVSGLLNFQAGATGPKAFPQPSWSPPRMELSSPYLLSSVPKYST
jgi:hypothetical protein